mmetsp:Transcript_6400/g.9416  ORF Transcript_6400/g.9416 Transcript_6400/m.9416 type:complete len:478 (+) Transcript_6400:23-1456(+)|eukprot:CAMPEP_0194217648 /NCGR_PEP_ID=MMETSP0156-20130528/21884_1 /TAXON_ID=33649 /ORGANISM="Thalassionema nitzschioides, Strain L26-B" /LENGTH=477 /DNA_ID=CAMNT_0038946749 /DNA_START=5 /DNA_END=1438 /DNA_ORIENTATION=+
MAKVIVPIFVDVLIPVHNAAETIEEAVDSAMNQSVPPCLKTFYENRSLDIAVCCYNDGSIDNSWEKLKALEKKYVLDQTTEDCEKSANETCTKLLIAGNPNSNGAPYARNQAAKLRSIQSEDHIIVWLDSDDIMHHNRIPIQVEELLNFPEKEKLLLGSQFVRDPPDSTWHYSQWANNLSDERLILEKFREVTVLQPTWCMLRSRFELLGGYIDDQNRAPSELNKSTKTNEDGNEEKQVPKILRLVHPDETPKTLRLAEDLRLFHAHLYADGHLRLVRQPLLSYRHRYGLSQSSQTPRKLLLQLRVLAFEWAVLKQKTEWSKFIIWGAGRDGKDFVKALSRELLERVVCMVDVDRKKIETGYYINKDMNIKIPIVHFSLLVEEENVRRQLQEDYYSQADNEDGRIRKGKPQNLISTTHLGPRTKKCKVCLVPVGLDEGSLRKLPVVVCVAMHRTNGVLEKNVSRIGRQEGKDLFHFS